MTFLEGKLLAVMMVGSTHYVDVDKGVDAIIYYASSKVAHMTLPNGPTWTGKLELKGDGYFVDWEDGPAGDWRIGYEPGVFTYFGPDGKPAGNITKIVPGNPEGF